MGVFTVYMHKNKVNGKLYFGITSQTTERRWRKDGSGYKSSQYLHHAINKYGWINFESVVLKNGLTKEEAENEEIRLIRKYESNNPTKGYNIANGGSVAGKHSLETRRIMSKKARLRRVDYSKIEKMREANKNRVYTKEHRSNISKALTGKKLSESHVESLRISHLGYKHPEEQKRKISESVKRTKGTEEHRKMISKKMKAVYKENPDLITNAVKANQRKVVCLTTGEVFNQIKDGAEKYGLKSRSGITEACQGKRAFSGKHPDGRKLKWAYYEDYQALEN